MQWDEYYDKLAGWAISTAVSRMSKLESFGPPDEIIDAINHLGFYDEKAATRLLKKAVNAGVKFTGDQLSELFLICEEDAIHRAVRHSSDQFTTPDLDALYGFIDEDDLIHIANEQNIPLPQSLIPYADLSEDEPEEDIPPAMTKAELVAACDYILDCLRNAHELLQKAYQFSLIDTNRKKRAATVAKYACIADAQTCISAALDTWNDLDIPVQRKSPLQGIWPNISNATMWKNYLFEVFLMNLTVKRQIRRVMKHIQTAYDRIRKIRNSLSGT